jgi:two-component system, chemotaxis family, response regulator Rcp1
MIQGPEVLLVDDSAADLDLTREGLRRSRQPFQVSVVMDGADAISFLRRQGKHAQAPEPDLIVLDLNLPRKDGREVLSELKKDLRLNCIPVVIFTTSQANSDVNQSYAQGANCYLTKPGTFPEYAAAVQSMADFWLSLAILPRKEMQ